MKKLILLSALAIASMTASAQKTLSLSTYSGTDISAYDNQVTNVSLIRYIFNGWNTIALPFSMSADQVCEVFGSDCRLEKLAGIENDGSGIKLNFQDCKAEGIKANTPYILKYNGETGSKRIDVENALIINKEASVWFTAAQTGEVVTFAAASSKIEAKGLYGILAKDNSEASFVNVDDNTSGFYATRCFIMVSSGNSTFLSSNHIEDATSINSVIKGTEKTDVYSISGAKVASSLNAKEISRLTPGVYVVKGKKVTVK